MSNTLTNSSQPTQPPIASHSHDIQLPPDEEYIPLEEISQPTDPDGDPPPFPPNLTASAQAPTGPAGATQHIEQGCTAVLSSRNASAANPLHSGQKTEARQGTSQPSMATDHSVPPTSPGNSFLGWFGDVFGSPRTAVQRVQAARQWAANSHNFRTQPLPPSPRSS